MTTAGFNVKRIIAERGLKQGAVAKKAGYTEKAFSNMLNGRKIISALDIVKISAVLGVTPNDLLNTQGESL
ncbi:MAG: helix-turn-helix domain-containing protein [Defluviitaleaceae bacterium]|nr:helix-turn-helix domain-containing protein [Defluviitaleaceae bacterium]